jgi:hypothetical protein
MYAEAWSRKASSKGAHLTTPLSLFKGKQKQGLALSDDDGISSTAKRRKTTFKKEPDRTILIRLTP